MLADQSLNCRSLRLALPQAQEVLKSSRGALMWHGRDLRHFKRILAPPLQQLLTQVGGRWGWRAAELCNTQCCLLDVKAAARQGLARVSAGMWHALLMSG